MSEAKGWMEDRICDECKKHISVLYPDLWQYKRKEGQGRKATYWCSWKCMRASEKKEEAKKEMRKLTLDNKKKGRGDRGKRRQSAGIPGKAGD